MLHFSHSSIYFHIHVTFSYSWLCMHGSVHSYAWFIFTARENMIASLHIHIQLTKNHFQNSRQCILVWSSCLKFTSNFQRPDGCPRSRALLSHNSALSHQRISWRSGMSFALHQEGHRFGPPFAHIFMFCNFFCCSIFLSTLIQASDKKKITCQTMALG